MAKPHIIGLFGLPSSGRTSMLKQLSDFLPHDFFNFYEGYDVIASLFEDNGGIWGFLLHSKQDQQRICDQALDQICADCAAEGKHAIVAAPNLLSWDEGDPQPWPTFTPLDQECKFTQVYYLDLEPETIQDRMRDSPKRTGYLPSLHHITAWQESEKKILEVFCVRHRIPFVLRHRLQDQQLQFALVRAIVPSVLRNEGENDREALQAVEKAVTEYSERLCSLNGPESLETMLVIDADKAMAFNDTNAMFWRTSNHPAATDFLRGISRLYAPENRGYDFYACLQVALYYEMLPEAQFKAQCMEVAKRIFIPDDWVEFLQSGLFKGAEHVGAILVSSGPKEVWELVLAARGLSDLGIHIVAGGNFSSLHLVSSITKTDMIVHLQDHHDIYVHHFSGPYPDFLALWQANESFIVTKPGGLLDPNLRHKIHAEVQRNGFKAQEIPMTEGIATNDIVQPLLNRVIPMTSINRLCNTMLSTPYSKLAIALQYPSDLLSTSLRKIFPGSHNVHAVHASVGWQLAINHVSLTFGLEEFRFRKTSPQGSPSITKGSRLRRETSTLIVSASLASVFMADGIAHAFPEARHLRMQTKPDNFQNHDLRGIEQVVLVETFMVNGGNVERMIKRLRDLAGPQTKLQIVIVTGSLLPGCLRRHSCNIPDLLLGGGISIVALRIEELEAESEVDDAEEVD